MGDYILDVMNDLLGKGRFSKVWKNSKVVLIPKPTKAENQDKSYRPICLVNTCGKLYGQLIKTRLESEIERNGGLSPRQFGFRKGLSTMDAVQLVLDRAKNVHRRHPPEWCVMVAVDVRNAFNTADWGIILDALNRKGTSGYILNVVKSYFSERHISVRRGEAPREVNVGVPQGSILGPLLWNVMYDALLGIDLPEGVSMIGYADDIALIGHDRNWNLLEMKMADALRRTNAWIRNNKLSIAPEKSEAVALKFGRRKREWEVTLLGGPIDLTPSIRYLGIVLDTSVSFGPHIRMAAAKAEATAKALVRLMPNVGGPGEKKRRALGAAVHSILLYGAPVWAQAMGVGLYRRLYQSVQRKVGLRITRAYRTVSYDAITVLAQLVPIHLLAEERQRIWHSDLPKKEASKRERNTTIAKWQEEWARGIKGAWTRRLIPEVKPWIERKHGEVSFHLAQAVTGHGAFKSYTNRIGKTEESACPMCEKEDTPEHTLFVCPRYEHERRTVFEHFGEHITPDNLIPRMLSSKRSWDVLEEVITDIMKDKE